MFSPKKYFEKLTSVFSASSSLNLDYDQDLKLKSYITVSANKQSLGEILSATY